MPHPTPPSAQKRRNPGQARSTTHAYFTPAYVEMTSVLNSGGIGYQGTNPVRNEINKLQRQIDDLKLENTYLLTALFKLSPDVVTEFEKVKADERARKEEEAARAAAEARLAQQQAQMFSPRMGGSGSAQGTYSSLYNGGGTGRFR